MATNRYIRGNIFALVFIILIFPLCSLVWAVAYYVDATGGNDSNSGLSESTSWKSVAKVNSSRFNPGDQILFKRGAIWREQLFVSSSGSSGNPITFGAYGSGNKPKLLGSVNLNGSSNWQLYSFNIWKSASTISADVGNLIFNNESSCGKKKSSLTSMVSQGDFYYDPSAKYLYVYSTSNPGTYYTVIEAAKRNNGVVISMRNYVTVQEFDIRYWGAHGIQIDGYSGNCDNIIIQRNDISYIGGSYQFGTTRFGNGIEQWDNGTNLIVRYNRINQVYDAGMTTQGETPGNTKSDQLFYYNIVTNSEYGFEFFNRDATSRNTRIKIYNNVFYNNGGGWGHSQRPDVSGIGFVMWGSTAISTSCQFQNNIIHTSAQNSINVDDANDLLGWSIDYNDLYPDGPIKFKIYTTHYDFTGWKTNSKQDGHSITSNPLFVSTSDFHLQSTSPAINAGTNVGLTQDFDGNPISGVPDMGAFEFIGAPDNSPAAPQSLRIQ